MRSNISVSCYEGVPTGVELTFEMFDFERNFNYRYMFFWYRENWKLSFYIVGIYLAVILGGRRWMKARQPFQLQASLFFWNLALAAFSILSCCRIVPGITYNALQVGLGRSLCHFDSLEYRQSMSVWGYFFALSKVVELGDTVFIVLRKTPLLFLHVYHHVSVLLFVWGSSAYPSVMHVYFAVINGVVHSFMYSYYALKVLRVPIPRACMMAITILQLLQMAIGILLIVSSYIALIKDYDCCVFEQALIIAIVIYSSYFVLFLNYFVKAYLSKMSIFDVIGMSKKKQ